MSLTILFQIPVDTGTANVSKEWDNPNLKDFYLLTGKSNSVKLRLRPPQADRGSVSGASLTSSSISIWRKSGAANP